MLRLKNCLSIIAEEAKPETEVKVEVEVETTATEEPPKTEEAAEKKEEEKPAEGEGGKGVCIIQCTVFWLYSVQVDSVL